jgi:hypothetical protein
VVKAHIGDFVALLSEHIAGTNQNNRRNPQYPETPQLFNHPHSVYFPPVKSWRLNQVRSSSGVALVNSAASIYIDLQAVVRA